jgi:hypothetical protein
MPHVSSSNHRLLQKSLGHSKLLVQMRGQGPLRLYSYGKAHNMSSDGGTTMIARRTIRSIQATGALSS